MRPLNRTSSRRSRRRSPLPALGLLAMLACSQESPEPATPDAPARRAAGTLERVVDRLGPGRFPGAPTPVHGPVVQLGDEARPVVRAPEEILVDEIFGAVPKEGVASARVELPAKVASLPDAAFVLSVQELPFTQALGEEVMARIARENFSLRRNTGWRLLRDGPDSVLELEHDGEDAVQLNLHLTAQLPVPETLESEPFDVPARSHIQLGFGLSGSLDLGAARDVSFVATLLCPDAAPRELVRKTISTAGEGSARWHDASAALSDSTISACRLRLDNRTADGTPSRAVWAVPRVTAPDDRTPDDTNVILISLDTLRSDHLSGLGYPRKTSPIMDAELIAKGTTFTDTSSTFPQTDVSHLSIFTGLYPSAQPKRGRVAASDRLVMLTEVLQAAGLETAAFTENALVSGAFGFWFGFDQFTERSFAHADRGRPTIEDGIRYVEANRDRRFFLFLHTYKTHDPYVPGAAYDALWSDANAWRDGGPAPWIPEQHREILDRYDRTIREADDLVGELLDALDRLGLADRTIIVVTSDHGEAFGEHGLAGHGFTPHQEALDVPLVFRGPGIPEGLRVDTPVSITDLTPTLLDMLALAPLAQSQGESLTPALAGRALPADRPLFYSWLRPDAYGVRRNMLKYSRTAKGHEQFDLASDPNEWKPDRSDAAREDAERILAEHEREASELRAALRSADPETTPPTVRSIDKRLERSLEALGYLD